MTRRIIAAVSYLNTIPFIYGIEHAGNIPLADLLLSPPKDCAERLAAHQADFVLVPSAGLEKTSGYEIITDYCIGASGPVRSVVLLSDHPLHEIDTIYLDTHSLTSVRLARILASEYWGISPRWRTIDEADLPAKPPSRSGFVLIGDKVFTQEGRFRYSLDLASEWIAMTGLPFVFALWTAKKGIPPEEIEKFNKALAFGLSHIPQAIEKYGFSEVGYACDYLTHNIDFKLDGPKLKALELFREKGAKL